MIRYFFILLASIPLIAGAQINDSTQRRISLQGALNFRDLGGYHTKDGKTIKWGKIYRSAELGNMTESDLDKLAALHIHEVMDFRGPAEVSTLPDKIPLNAVRVSLPYGSEQTGDRAAMMKMMSTATSGDSIMLPFYTNISSFGKRYRPVFISLLHTANDSAVLFHCTAGKDRTGIGAALILYTLGVDEKTIMEDYLASNYYRAQDNINRKKLMVSMYHMKEEVADDVFQVKPRYLEATFATIRSQYGSVDNYLEKEMGIDAATKAILKSKYLQ